MPERLILRNFQSAGDILMLTATVRDLHRCYPGRFVTDVRRTSSGVGGMKQTKPAQAMELRSLSPVLGDL